MKNCSRFLSFRRNLYLVFTLIFIFSCKEKQDLKLTGKYGFVRDYKIPIYTNDGYELPPPPPKKNLGFNFYSKDSCESNYKYYDPKSFDVDYYSVSFGRKTAYKIDNDSLKVFDRTLERWKSYAILHFDKNNLTLFDGAFVESYAKNFNN